MVSEKKLLQALTSSECLAVIPSIFKGLLMLFWGDALVPVNRDRVRALLLRLIPMTPHRHAAFPSLCVDRGPLSSVEKLATQSLLFIYFVATILQKHGGRSRGQAVQSGICQERPRVVQEMQGKHSERLAENGHHGAGNDVRRRFVRIGFSFIFFFAPACRRA